MTCQPRESFRVVQVEYHYTFSCYYSYGIIRFPVPDEQIIACCTRYELLGRYRERLLHELSHHARSFFMRNVLWWKQGMVERIQRRLTHQLQDLLARYAVTLDEHDLLYREYQENLEFVPKGRRRNKIVAGIRESTRSHVFFSQFPSRMSFQKGGNLPEPKLYTLAAL